MTVTLPSALAERAIVSVGGYIVAKNNIILSTYGLGTCVGVVIFDKINSIGGMLHLMLPDSKLSPEKAEKRPAMFADTGFKQLMQTFWEYGGMTQNANVLIAGGASILNNSEGFNIGQRNSVAVKQQMNHYKLVARVEETGGFDNRTLHLNIGTGEVDIKTSSGKKTISLK